MKTNHIPIFLLSSLITFLHLHSTCSEFPDERSSIRRILHQPPPPSTPDLPDPADQTFFHQHPNQSQHSLPTPVSNSVAPTQNHPKGVAIGITSGILTLAILSAIAFYLHKCRSNHSHQAPNLFTPPSSDQQSELPPSTFLYIGTVDPTTANTSPYRKLKPGKVSQRYRPSPDLQPLPPLPKPSPPPTEDESRATAFHGSSSVTNASPNNNSLPLYRRASPKSRPSPDTRPSIIPSIKQFPPPESSSLGPLQPSKTLAYAAKRAEYAAPPKLQSIINDDQQTIPLPIPPPPPSIPVKFGSAEPNTPSPVVSEQATKPADSTSVPGVDFREEDKGESKPKLKALHWDKVRATSERATVWDQLKSSLVPLNEDAMESLFRCNSDILKEAGARKKSLECILLDPKKSQNIAILLRALNVTSEEVSEALLDGNPDRLSVELLETLVKMAPTKEEEIKLKDYNDISRLGSAEQFLKRILNVPFAFKRAEAMLYRANFDAEVAYLRNSFRTLEEASEELKSSRLFLKLLEAVLQTGNRMNDGTNRGDAKAFKLDTLLKLADVKGADGKTTLLHFVVQEIIRKEGVEVVSGMRKELGSIRKAAGIDSDVLRGYVCKLEMGLEKVRLVTPYEGGKFSSYMKGFLKEAVGEIGRIKAEEREVTLRVRELTEYFHGDAAKEEAHPLRIFSIVRDFLGILSNVCRDVQDATIVLEI